MNRKIGLLITLVGFCVFLGQPLLFAQTEIKPEKAAVASPDADVQWVWGEVINIDYPNKAFTVKYFDYETETEKNIQVAVNNDTGYEGALSLDEIKPKDTVSVDYVSAGGNNIAKNIGVERPETNPEVTTKPEINVEEEAQQQVEASVK